MNGSSGDQLHQQNNLSKSVSLSRSVVVTQDTCIPSLLILGKLLCVSNGAGGGGTAAIDMAGLLQLQAKLRKDWAPSGTVKFWRVTDGAFLIQFHEEEDLTRVLDGAPWCCDDDGGLLLLMQHIKPDVNLQEQLDGVGFTTVDLWVQFHNVPVEYFSVPSFYMLAKEVGVPVVFPELGTATAPAPVDLLLRARIRVDITKPLVRSIPVILDDGRREVSVVYERIPSLCASCGSILSDHHPADRCPKVAAAAVAAAAAAAASASRSRRERSAGGSGRRSRLGSQSSSSSAEKQPLLDKEDASGGSPARSTLQPKPGESSAAAAAAAAAEHPAAPDPDLVVSVNNRCLPCNFLNLIMSRRAKKVAVGYNKITDSNDQDRQDESQKHQTLLLKFKAEHNVQDEESRPDSRLALATPSSFLLAGGYINYYAFSGSRRNPRIEVMVKTQCSSTLISKAMEWLAENTGLKASYDGQKGVISIVGLQVDQRMGPLDLVAYLCPEAGLKRGVSESPEKPNSPARFEDMIIRLHDETACRKNGGCSSSRVDSREGQRGARSPQ